LSSETIFITPIYFDIGLNLLRGGRSQCLICFLFRSETKA
jgi:hypothetical protein